MKRLFLIKDKILSLLAAAVLSVSAVQPAHALFGVGDIVIDPSNLAQNIMTAARTLQMVNNQIQQLQNEANMLLNEARNLQGLDFSALNSLREAYENLRALFEQAEGLAFEVTQLQTEFDRLYPRSFDGRSFSAMTADRNEQLTQAREAWRMAMQVQARAYENFADDTDVLSHLIDRSQSSVGILQATQAGNQLLGLHIRELMQSQQLQIAQDRAAAVSQARTVAAEARSHELRRQFMTTTTRYTPEPVQGF